MSEEKMQTDQAFLAAVVSLKEVKRGDDSDGDFLMRLYYHIWQAALQESEAGAKNDSMATALLYHLEREAFGQVISPQLAADIRKHLNAMKPVYLASPAAQAIETAAYMRAAEVCERVTGYGAEACHDTILALIPQDGRTQLEQKCMEVAQEVKSATVFNECRNMLTKENELRAIVTNLIGATK